MAGPCCRAQILGGVGLVVVPRELSRCSFWALEHRLGSWGTQVQLSRGMWDLPGSGMEPVSPAMADGFFTIEPPRKPLKMF